MKNKLLKLAMVAIAVLITTGAATAAPMTVKVKNIIGKVETQTGGAWKNVSEGENIAVGASLRTGPASSCIIVWAGGNTAKLSPLTNIKISAADKDASGKESTTIDMAGGKFVAHAKKLPTKDSSFKVKTPSAVAGIRGTDEIIEVNEKNESNIGVAEGSVEIEAGGETIVVEEGFMLDIDSTGSMSEPETIPAEVMEAVKEDLKEVNDESKQAESEAVKEESKESKEEAKEDKKESKEDAKEDSKESKEEAKEDAKEETASGDSAGDDEAASDDSAGEIDTSAVTDSIDSALDTAQDATVAETAEVAGEEAIKSGSLDITIDFITQ